MRFSFQELTSDLKNESRTQRSVLSILIHRESRCPDSEVYRDGVNYTLLAAW